MPAKIILNPYANRWGAKRRAPDVRRILDALAYDYDWVETEGPGHGMELAREAATQGFDPIVAAGGDGAISEVVNGLVEDGDVAQATLGVLPLGAANDYAYQLGIPDDDLETACRLLVEARHVRTLDLGRANQHVFMNDFIVGLGAIANMEAAKIQRIHGETRYILGAVKAILKAQWPTVGFRWDDGEMPKRPILMSYISIGYRTGGVYFFSPRAQQDDGKIDFLTADARSRLGVFKLLPKTMKGTHTHEPGVYYHQCTWVAIESDDPLPMLVDGEIKSDFPTEVDVRVLPGAIRVISGVTPGPRPEGAYSNRPR
ncbi:MAG TPA: diacylglycerol kinase family lipid kinase [Anaerolineae bacterium]|nr:diacylglycerol kinase family lipid kinase [Caldilineae bacterium]HID33216.1 diacylglycerol kinase family lipid kinase [Anaerolineae bacterium]HIQ11682.1 diacylglycerol kinase family lipid kinase [Caldilineales bacterium]